MKTLTLTAPRHWASAIVNMDYSGLNDTDKSQLNTFLANNSLSFSERMPGCSGMHEVHF